MQLSDCPAPPRPVQIPARQERFERPSRFGIMAERLFTFFYVILGVSVSYGAYVALPRFASGGPKLEAGESDPVGMVGNILVLAGLIPALWMQRHRLRSVVRPMVPYILIVTLCIVSSVWSPYPLVSFRKSINLGVCVLFGVYLFLRLGLNRTLNMVIVYTAVAAILSVLLYFAIPSLGHETQFLGYENALRGVFPQKNVAGEAMLTAQIALVYLVMTSQMSVVTFSVLTLFFFGVQIMTMSASATMVTMVVWAFGAFLFTKGRIRLRLLFLYLGGSAGIVLAAIVLFDPELIFAAAGRDASLTGRVPLWTALIPFIKQRFFLGWGYSGFFLADSLDTQALWASIEWQPSNAHNGYLDILLQIGAIGLGLYAWVWVRNIRLSYFLLRPTRWTNQAPEALWCALFMAANIALNVDEGPLPYQDQFTMLMPATILGVEFAYRRHRERTAAAQLPRQVRLRPSLAAE